MNSKGNLFETAPPPSTGERFDTLVRCRNVTIERISSSDQPDPVRYDQSQDEWVLLLQGQARLEVGTEAVTLGPGDHLFLPAHTPHRVLTTSANPPCLWVAVHIYPDPDPD